MCIRDSFINCMRTLHYFLFFLSLVMLCGIASAQIPQAAFGGIPVSGASPLTVSFTDSSAGSPTGWAWYFGDENFAASWTQQTANAGWNRTSQSSVVMPDGSIVPVSYTHLRAHETDSYLVCRL